MQLQNALQTIKPQCYEDKTQMYVLFLGNINADPILYYCHSTFQIIAPNISTVIPP